MSEDNNGKTIGTLKTFFVYFYFLMVFLADCDSCIAKADRHIFTRPGLGCNWGSRTACRFFVVNLQGRRVIYHQRTSYFRFRASHEAHLLDCYFCFTDTSGRCCILTQ